MHASARSYATGPDDKLERLHAMLARMAKPQSEQPIVINAEIKTFEALIERLSCEIDETVLPRILGLVANGAIVATITAANRRLITLQIAEVLIQPDPAAQNAPSEAAGTYAQALKGLFDKFPGLGIERLGRAIDAPIGSNACTARHLAAYAGQDTLENRTRVFLKGVHAVSVGWICRIAESEAVAHDPDKEVFDGLMRLDEKCVAVSAPAHGYSRLEIAEPTCATFALSQDVQVLIAKDGKDNLIVAVPQREVDDLLSRWQQLFTPASA